MEQTRALQKQRTVEYYEDYLLGLKRYYTMNPDLLGYDNMVGLEYEILRTEGLVRRIRYISAKRFEQELNFVK